MRFTLTIVGMLAAFSADAQTTGVPPAPLPTIIEGPGASAPPKDTPEAAYERGRREQREADAKRAAESEGGPTNDGILFDPGYRRGRGPGRGPSTPKQDGLASSGLGPSPFPAATLTPPILPEIARPRGPIGIPFRGPEPGPGIR